MVAGVAEVSIDRAGDGIRVHNFWCAIDPGIAVQPDNVVAQMESSIVYGLGLAGSSPDAWAMSSTSWPAASTGWASQSTCWYAPGSLDK